MTLSKKFDMREKKQCMKNKIRFFEMIDYFIIIEFPKQTFYRNNINSV